MNLMMIAILHCKGSMISLDLITEVRCQQSYSKNKYINTSGISVYIGNKMMRTAYLIMGSMVITVGENNASILVLLKVAIC